METKTPRHKNSKKTTIKVFYLDSHDIHDGTLDLLREYPNLRVLEIENAGEIKDFTGISNCPSLENLAIRNTSLANLDGIEFCTELRSVTLFDTDLIDLSVLDGSGLEDLHIDSATVEILPANLPGLTTLTLIANSVQFVPSYPCLENITIVTGYPETRIEHMPNIVSAEIRGSLKDLEFLRGAPITYLDCCDTLLTRLVPMPDLEHLICNNNHIYSLEELSVSRKLQTLECHKNRLINLKGLERAKKLTTVAACENDIFDIGALRDLPNLTNIQLSCNSIMHVPRCLFIANDTVINLNNNLIEDVSNLLSDTVKYCHLKGNPLNEESIGLIKARPKVYYCDK